MKAAAFTWFGFAAVVALVVGTAACSQDGRLSSEGTAEQASSEAGEHATAESGGEHSGEHAGEHGEAGHDEEGEESGVYIGKGETWDVVRRGARLALTFDPASNAFVGTVENTTAATLCAVRVEVHLSTGTELGPTPRTDVESGQKIDVRLSTEGAAFDTWTAHPELSPCGGV